MMCSNQDSHPTLGDNNNNVCDENHYNIKYQIFHEGDLDFDDENHFIRELYQDLEDKSITGKFFYEAQFRRALMTDDKPKFVSLVQEWLRTPGRPDIDVFEMACCEGAICCAIALLEGETGLSVNLNAPSLKNKGIRRGLYPLHEEAQRFNYDLVDLLLCYGARIDVTCSIEDMLFLDTPSGNGRRLLPLEVALESFEYHLYLQDWTPKESIFKLLIILCSPPMIWPLETVRLLASTTKEVSKVFNYYVKEGRPIQVAVMLMVAREFIKFPMSMLQRKGDSVIHRSIMSICEIFMELEEKKLITRIENMNGRKRFIGNSQSSRFDEIFTAQRATLNYVWMLLEVFEKAGYAIGQYRLSRPLNVSKESLVRDVATILEKAGVFLDDKDIDLRKMDWDCFETEEAMGPVARKCLRFPHLLLHPLEKKPRIKPTNMPVDTNKKISLFRFPFTRLPPTSSFSNFQTSSAFHTQKAEFKGQTSATDRCMLTSEIRNQLAFLAASLKRGTRRL